MTAMNDKLLRPLQTILQEIDEKPATAWVYLPDDKNWTLASRCAVLESEEVPPELEDDPDAGIPAFAKENKLIQALPVTAVQDLVANAETQKPDVAPLELFAAFMFYYTHDAFIDFGSAT